MRAIDGWESFQTKFTKRWAHKHDNSLLLQAFSSLKKAENKTVVEFNTKLSKAYYRIPTTVRPNEEFALLYHLEAFDSSFNFLLREKEPLNLDATFFATIKIKKNINET